MGGSPKRVSLRDISIAAGVSISTVSQCLLSKPGPNAQTARRIKELAAQMGYRPNPILSSLARTKFKASQEPQATPVAVILHCTDPAYYPANLEQEFRSVAIKDSAAKLGYKVNFYRFDKIANPKALMRELYHRGTVGIMFCLQSTQDVSFFLDNDWSQFPIVIASNDYRLSQFHLACGNIFESVRLVWVRLQALNYRRIGWAVLKHPTCNYDDFIRSSCIGECLRHTPPEYQIPPLDASFHDKAIFHKWFMEHKPEVVVGFHAGQYFWLTELGLRIPQDVAFCYLHVQDVDLLWASTASIVNMDAEIAQSALTLLDQLVKHHSLGLVSQSCRIVINPVWRDGLTCPPSEK